MESYSVEEYYSYSSKIIEELSKINSILSFAEVSQFGEKKIDLETSIKYKNQYKLYSTSTLS
jgi:hypothetical protein